MARYFSLEELTRSATARAMGIDNTPAADIIANLERLIDELLDPVRAMWGAPLRVNSGYRCAALNREVGGAAGSSHLRGEAADITTGSRGGNRRLFEMVISSGLVFDQLIDESDYSWLHISYRGGGDASGANRGQVLHL